MTDERQGLISVEPFKISIVQIVATVFAAGILWGGYQALSKSVTELTRTMRTVNDTMLVLKANRDSDKRVQSWLVDKIEETQKKESKMEAAIERHESDISTIKKKVGL